MARITLRVSSPVKFIRSFSARGLPKGMRSLPDIIEFRTRAGLVQNVIIFVEVGDYGVLFNEVD